MRRTIGALAGLVLWTGCAGAKAEEPGVEWPFDIVGAAPADFDGVLQRVGDRLSGHAVAHVDPRQSALPVTGKVTGRDVELTIGTDTAAFVFSGTLDDADVPVGGLMATGILIGPDVGPVVEHVSLLASGEMSLTMR